MGRFRRAALLVIAVLGAATVVQAAAAAAPTAITGTVSAVGGTSATLNGTVNPGGAATDWWFEYGTSTSYGSKSATTAAGSGSANVAVSQGAQRAQSPATTYHYRLVAKNATATTNGADGLFTTASPPVAVTAPATGVGPTTATLGGTVNPNGEPTTWYVEYGTSTSYGSEDADDRCRSRAAPSKAVSVGVTGLAAGKTYHFRLVATSSAGTVQRCRCDLRHRRGAGATTSAASSLSSTGATLNGKVDANGRATTYVFEYGTTTSYGTKTSSSSAGSGANAVNVSKAVTGLKPGVDLSLPARSRRVTRVPSPGPTRPSRPTARPPSSRGRRPPSARPRRRSAAP